MANINPVKIWIVRASPRREPKFHQADRLGGAGRSARALFNFFNGWLGFRIQICVRERNLITGA